MSDDEHSVRSVTSVASGSSAVKIAKNNPGIKYIHLEDFHCRAPKIYNAHSLICGNLLKTCRGHGHGDLAPGSRYRTGTYRVLRGRNNTFRGILANTRLSDDEEKAMQEEQAAPLRD